MNWFWWFWFASGVSFGRGLGVGDVVKLLGEYLCEV